MAFIASTCSLSRSRTSTSHLAIPSCLTPSCCIDKIVVRGRGGYCYELNGLFHDLLTALGFTVQMLSARVRREDGGFGPEFDHMLLKVMLDEPWLADVGFGESFVSPLLLQCREPLNWSKAIPDFTSPGRTARGTFFGATERVSLSSCIVSPKLPAS